MAFGDLVGTPGEATAGSVGSLAVTFSSATAGNLLIAVFARSIGVTWGADPTDWEVIHTGVGDFSVAWYWKIAAGGETSVTATTTETTGTWRGAVCEFEGPFEASPLDVKAEDESNLGPTDTSQSSGTTGTTAQNDELAVAAYGAQAAAFVTDGRSYSNSFAEAVFSNESTANTRPAVIVTRKVLSATGTVESTFTTTDTGDEMYGSVATFKKAAGGGGGTVYPVISEAGIHSAVFGGQVVR